MHISNRTKRLFFIFLTVFIVSFVTLTGLYFYTNRFIGSGFFFQRLAKYISYEGQTNIDIGRGHAFPFAPFFVTITSRVTGLNTITTVYLPYLTIVPLIYCYFFTRNFLSKKHYAILLAFIVFISTAIARAPHFNEYHMGYFLFPLFSVLILKFCNSKDYRFIFLSVCILVTMKFYFPYEEIFSVTFLFLFLISLYLIKMFNIKSFDNDIANIMKPLKNFALFSIVLLISYQPKGETLTKLLYGGIYEFNPFSTLKNFLYGVGGNDHLDSVHRVPQRAPQIPFVLNTILTLLLLFSIIIIFVLLVNKFIINKNLDQLTLNDLIIFLMFSAYYPYAIGKLSIGQPSYLLMPLYIIGPVFIYHFSGKFCDFDLGETKKRTESDKKEFRLNLKKIKKKFPIIVIIIIIILASTHHIFFITTETHRPVGPDEQNIAIATHLQDKSRNGTRVLTDLDTYGVVQVYQAQSRQKPNNISHVKYTDSRYSFIIGMGNESERNNIDLILVNELTDDRPMQRGSPDWAHFKPLSNHHDDLRQNRNINLIYSSNQYEIYAPKYSSP